MDTSWGASGLPLALCKQSLFTPGHYGRTSMIEKNNKSNNNFSLLTRFRNLSYSQFATSPHCPLNKSVLQALCSAGAHGLFPCSASGPLLWLRPLPDILSTWFLHCLPFNPYWNVTCSVTPTLPASCNSQPDPAWLPPNAPFPCWSTHTHP